MNIAGLKDLFFSINAPAGTNDSNPLQIRFVLR